MYTIGAPVIKFISNHTLSLEGETVNLTCMAINDVDANLTLQIDWYKGNRSILHNETANGQLTSTLLLNPVSRNDDGEYTCQAFNHDDLYTPSQH